MASNEKKQTGKGGKAKAYYIEFRNKNDEYVRCRFGVPYIVWVKAFSKQEAGEKLINYLKKKAPEVKPVIDAVFEEALDLLTGVDIE